MGKGELEIVLPLSQTLKLRPRVGKMFIHSLAHSFIYSSSNASGNPPGARLSSKFHGQRAESDLSLSTGRSQSGRIKDTTASP